MKRSAATLKDVASAAGVSAMTVSKALRNAPGVSDKTRERVLAIAQNIGYETNVSASALKTGRSGIIQIIVNEYDIPFYSKLIDVMSSAVVTNGFTPFLQQTKYSTSALQSTLSSSLFSGVLSDGVIAHASGLSGDLFEKIIHGKPAVLIDSCEEQPVVSSVVFPNEEGSRAAVQYLAERGCRNIGLIGPSYLEKQDFLHSPSPMKLRMRGARAALLDLGLPYDESTVVAVEGMSEEHAIDSVHELAKSGRIPFDGLFCLNDSAAIGAIRALADCGIRVPEDVKVIGFDGVREGRFHVPSLTTISVDMDQLARLVMLSLKQQIDHTGDPLPATKTTIGFTLVERESTQTR
ncbi:LacI family DNA-binding transcriptional regulator [Bifidobacterium biavatii]|uniref:LacI family transcription regulator n=1 Tax=Bifidobacterium biavatii DSM 23969 TaxID=1437608 RepID=A0A086ZUW2_9BIFI|nr:LacI family DNA-binding transcriptional regulator [Bifidobacterium biavatii]KFI50312.1 LacI family transcription regulator [Bifidobacterium biavatii DSM 23969]